jgi:regulator of replication initiation timing
MSKQALARTVDVDPIDRLEDKVKLLVGLVTQLREEQTKAADENARLAAELTAVRAQLAEAEGTSTELAVLRDERDLIRTRVTDMLQQLEHLSL